MGCKFLYKRGCPTSSDDIVVMIQRMLNVIDFRKNGKLVEDGIYGKQTEKAIKDFQRWRGLMVDGIVGKDTFFELLGVYTGIDFTIRNKALKEEDIIHAAIELRVEVPALKAVIEVESAGSGFVEDKPKILFEGHVFWRLLKKSGWDPEKLQEGYEDVLYEHWTKKYYKGGLAEYNRLEKAKEIHPALALESCSWGLFQIMGYYWQKLDYTSIHHFVECMYENEAQQLYSFVRFIKSANKLADYLRERNWAEFAYYYNGSAYYLNEYDKKLEKAYNRYKEVN